MGLLLLQIQPDWSQYKRSKFKELVQKQILSTRVEKIRKQNAKSLSDAMTALQKEFEGRAQEAKEILVSKCIRSIACKLCRLYSFSGKEVGDSSC